MPASAAHAAQIESQGKNKEMCGPVKTRLDVSTIVAPFVMHGSKAGYELENTMKFRHKNGKGFTVKLADTN